MVDISDKSIAEAWAAVKDNHSETNYAVFKYAGTSRVVTTEKTGKTVRAAAAAPLLLAGSAAAGCCRCCRHCSRRG